jgi:hypothetical protein
MQNAKIPWVLHAANIGRDGDALVQDDVVSGTGTDRAGAPEDRERATDERNVP